MITSDQPTIFPSEVLVAVSSVSDGNMSFKTGDQEQVVANRIQFLQACGIDSADATLVNLKYDNAEHFTRYYTVDSSHKQLGMTEPSDDMVADALATDTPGHALFLLIADCVATVLYDTSRHVLMLSHIGRHSAEADGGCHSVQYMTEQFGSDPADIRAWLSPAAGRENYPLYSMNGRGLHEVIVRQLIDAGIAPEAIETSRIDTTTSQEYFSHSRFLSGQTVQEDGRFAVVAMIRR